MVQISEIVILRRMLAFKSNSLDSFGFSTEMRAFSARRETLRSCLRPPGAKRFVYSSGVS